jgi:outer membrane protein assembly factor BamB
MVRLAAAAFAFVWVTLIASANLAWADPTLRWEASPAPGHLIAFAGKRVIVGGGSTLAAYDSRSGEKEWEISVDAGIILRDLVAPRRQIFAAGAVSQSSQAFVAAIDSQNGEVLWSDTFGYPSSVTTIAHAISAGATRIFVVGITGDFSEPTAMAFIRAYDSRTGERLWEDVTNLIPPVGSYLTATEAQGLVYLVAGRTDDNPPAGARFGIRTYDARTGALVWEDVLTPSEDFIGGATEVEANRRLVLTAGTADALQALFVRAYDRLSGRIVWEDRLSGGDLSGVTDLLLHRDRLVVSGFPGPGPSSGPILKAYDTNTGAVAWQQTPRIPGVNDDFQAVSALAAAGNTLFAAGSFETGDGTLHQYSLRALELRTGALKWEDRQGCGVFGEASAVIARHDVVVAVGAFVDCDGNSTTVIRAYGGASEK